MTYSLQGNLLTICHNRAAQISQQQVYPILLYYSEHQKHLIQIQAELGVLQSSLKLGKNEAKMKEKWPLFGDFLPFIYF